MDTHWGTHRGVGTLKVDVTIARIKPGLLGASVPLLLLSSALWGSACADDRSATEADSEASGSGDSSDSRGSGESETSGSEETSGPIAGLELLERLGGLWIGPGTMTPLGTFELMAMDLRDADPHTLFARADLDAANAIRFALMVETIGGEDLLVFRSGGLFSGMTRDTRTTLRESSADSWRFCAVDGGCDYVDACWELSADDQLVLDVQVQGQAHLSWMAERAQTRDLPEPFPEDSGSQGPGDGPFPPMPSLRASVVWGAPLAEPADVWVLLSTQDCPLAGLCDLSRQFSVEAPAGATSVEVLIEQLHPGPYRANSILDRDRNLIESMAPGSGDAVSIPNAPVVVADEGESAIGLNVVVEL